MKIVPVFKCRDLQKAIHHYTSVLDFKIRFEEDINSGVVDLFNENIELQLTIYERDTLFGSVANIWVTNVDDLFSKYVQRGLKVPNDGKSPVHEGPTDQTWGTREFYVTDSDGNTLRFCEHKQ